MDIMETSKITSCEVCGENTLVSVLDLGDHPICDELIPIGSEAINQLFPIEVHYCTKCYTAHQTTQINKKRLFPPTYHYRARFTADVLNGMRNLVECLQEDFIDLKDKKVLDIGCNDGCLLDFFREKGSITYGVEPTDAAQDGLLKHHTIVQDYFTPELAKSLPLADVITFTNVFAHIEDLKSLLEAIKTVSKNNTLLVIENHYLGGILGKNQFDSFYHEHPRTYSLNSFIHIAKTLGLDLLSVQFLTRYGGNIRVVIGDKNIYTSKVSSEKIEEILAKEGTFLLGFKKMNDFIDSWKIEKKNEILSYVEAHGKIKAKAFPARAAIPIKLLGLTNDHIAYVSEKPGSMKIGHYVPGTRIEIVSDENLMTSLSSEKAILNNAWHISSEIETYLRKSGFNGTFINII